MSDLTPSEGDEAMPAGSVALDILDLSDRQVLVVGGSAVALGRISGLLEAGARVTVVSPDVATSVRDLAERGLLVCTPVHSALPISTLRRW